MAQKRRIVPQPIPTAQAQPATSAREAPVTPLVPPLTVAGSSPDQHKGTMTLKEQSEHAAKLLGPGRRIYVELSEENYEINWRR